MNQKLKRIAALLLAMLMLCSVFTAYAQEGEPAPGESLQEPSEEPAADSADKPAEEAVVAKLWICARVSFLGHVWIYVENLCDTPILVGCYEVPAGSGVSVGTHKNRRADGGGVYYNVEAYMIHKLGSSRGVARSMELNAAQLEKVSRSILTHNSWSLGNNCGHFATRVWNGVSSRKVRASLLPLTVKNRIGSGAGPHMINPDRNNVYRQRGSGDNARLVVVSNRSLIKEIG